jgi:hypothetical protein
MLAGAKERGLCAEKAARGENIPEARPNAPQVDAQQLRAKVTSYISRAKDYRVCGNYRAALAELGTARAADPENTEVRAEFEQTQRACLAERRWAAQDWIANRVGSSFKSSTDFLV